MTERLTHAFTRRVWRPQVDTRNRKGHAEAGHREGEGQGLEPRGHQPGSPSPAGDRQGGVPAGKLAADGEFGRPASSPGREGIFAV